MIVGRIIDVAIVKRQSRKRRAIPIVTQQHIEDKIKRLQYYGLRARYILARLVALNVQRIERKLG